MSAFILSIDIATSAAKAVLYNLELEAVSITRCPYPVLHPRPGWSEQVPNRIFTAVIEAAKESVQSVPSGGSILATTLSSQMYSILAVDNSGTPLSNSIIWSDTRSSDIADSIRNDPNLNVIYKDTACPIDAVYPLSKIGWLKGEGIGKNVRFVSIKEYVLYLLTGHWLADWSIASGSGFFDIHKREWNKNALDFLKISPDNLSELVSPRTVIYTWRSEILSATGLNSGTPLVIGGGDGPLANLGVGAIVPSILAVNVGTSAAARCAVPNITLDPDERLWTYPVDDNLWVHGGMVSSGGGIYRWWVEEILEAQRSGDPIIPTQDHLTDMDHLAGEVGCGAEGLVFLPYLSGEQCPGWHPSTRGSFFGIGLHHHRGHMARAILEGITRSVFIVAEHISLSLNHPFREIRVTGGLVESKVWLKIAADMFGLPVAVPKNKEGSACGAAMVAGLALGIWGKIEDIVEMIVFSDHIQPNAEANQFYREQYNWFQKSLLLTREFSNIKEQNQ